MEDAALLQETHPDRVHLRRLRHPRGHGLGGVRSLQRAGRSRDDEGGRRGTLLDDAEDEEARIAAERERGGGVPFIARLDRTTDARERQPLEVEVDVTRLHFFDPETGARVDGGPGSGQPSREGRTDSRARGRARGRARPGSPTARSIEVVAAPINPIDLAVSRGVLATGTPAPPLRSGLRGGRPHAGREAWSGSSAARSAGRERHDRRAGADRRLARDRRARGRRPALAGGARDRRARGLAAVRLARAVRGGEDRARAGRDGLGRRSSPSSRPSSSARPGSSRPAGAQAGSSARPARRRRRHGPDSTSRTTSSPPSRTRSTETGRATCSIRSGARRRRRRCRPPGLARPSSTSASPRARPRELASAAGALQEPLDPRPHELRRAARRAGRATTEGSSATRSPARSCSSSTSSRSTTSRARGSARQTAPGRSSSSSPRKTPRLGAAPRRSGAPPATRPVHRSSGRRARRRRGPPGGLPRERRARVAPTRARRQWARTRH